MGKELEFLIRVREAGLGLLDRAIDQLEDAGVETAEFSKEAKALRDRLAELERQQKLVDNFTALKTEVSESGTALQQAQDKAQKLGRELGALEQPTKKQQGDFRKAREAVTDAKEAYQASQVQLQQLRERMSAAGVQTARLASEQVRLRTEARAVEATVAGTSTRLRDLAESSRRAAAETSKIGSAIDTTGRGADRYRQLLGEATKSTDRLSESAGGAGALLRSLGPQLAGAFSAQQFVQLLITSEALDRSFEAIFGSTQRARQEMQFVRETANRLGLDNLELARSYQSLAAATKGTALEGQATRDVFESVARAMATLGKSSVETDRALTAIAQMASKGAVSMEELRGQLGEALPGAMQAAASGAGITVQQLIEMVETGEVLAKDLLPALTKGLDDLYGKAAPPQNIISEWARLKNEVNDFGRDLGKSGASDAIATLLSAATGGARALFKATQETGEALGQITFATVDAAKTAVDYADKQLGASDALSKLSGSTSKATAAQQQLNAVQQEGQRIASQEAFRHQELVTQRAAETNQVLKLKAQSQELQSQQVNATAAAEKLLAVRTAEGAVLTKLVDLYGTENERHQVGAEVAQRQAEALGSLMRSREMEAILARSRVLQLIEEATRIKDYTEETRKQVDAADKLAKEKQLEFERSAAQLQAKRLEVEVSRAQAEATKDNAARLYEFRAAATAAATEVARLTEQKRQGKAVGEQLSQAQIELARTTTLYRDALRDAVREAETNISAVRRQAEMERVQISLEQERIGAAREVAEANGDGARVSQLAAQAIQLQAQASHESIAAARQEAEAIRATADRKEALAKATGGLTVEVREEIAALRQSAEVKEIDAQRAEILAQKTQQLANSEAARTAAIEKTIEAEERRMALAERAAELERKRLGVDREGYSVDKAGNRVNQLVESQASVAQRLKELGLGEEDAVRAARTVMSERGQPNLKSSGVYQDGDTLDAVLVKLAQRMGGAGAATVGGAKTVNVRLNGSSDIPTTEDGAQTMIKTLQLAKIVAVG